MSPQLHTLNTLVPPVLTTASVHQLLCLLPDIVGAQEQRCDIDIGGRRLLDALGDCHHAAGWSHNQTSAPSAAVVGAGA